MIISTSIVYPIRLEKIDIKKLGGQILNPKIFLRLKVLTKEVNFCAYNVKN